MMLRLMVGALGAAVVVIANVPVAQACGSFFCGQSPVDQNAERIVFAVDEDSITMVVQITYMGSSDDFAWVLPLSEVPEVESLATFSQQALTQLDANTSPQFNGGCFLDELAFSGSADGAGGGAPPSPAPEPEVTVHIRAEVGPYDVAVIESESHTALVEWLRDNDYRVGTSMEPYIEIYTREGLKFLALKLQDGADTNDIAPFKFTMPGTTPVIPLRMTALAAEPEMGILVTVLGDQRFGPANWPDLEINDEALVFDDTNWPIKTNWTALVAQAVDEAGGQGFVTELAESSAPLLERAMSSPVQDMETQQAIDDLVSLLQGRPYITRMYTRLSAEEMHSDPIFIPSAGEDVSRFHELPYDENACSEPPSPCAFTTCGAGGLCRMALGSLTGSPAETAGCACTNGATARTTFDPAGEPVVICQDIRMSFLNPGDALAGGTLDNPCDGFDCGEQGTCMAVNMTPTCICNQGYVAIGTVTSTGSRLSYCVAPMDPVPEAHYMQWLPPLPAELPGGREMPKEAMPAPSDILTVENIPEMPTPLGTPKTEPSASESEDDDDGCAVGGGPAAGDGLALWGVLGLLAWRRRR